MSNQVTRFKRILDQQQWDQLEAELDKEIERIDEEIRVRLEHELDVDSEEYLLEDDYEPLDFD